MVDFGSRSRGDASSYGFDFELLCHSECSEAESNCVAATQAESKQLFAQDDLFFET